MIIKIGIINLLAQESKPNIIVYFADDLGYLDVSVYGAEVVQTPVLQKLNTEGITFNNAFVASPSCAPSRAALLTGLMPAQNGAETNHSYPNENIPYLIKNLQDVGYKVFAFGKVAHYGGNKKCGFDFHHDEQVNLYPNIKKFFDTTEITTPICVFVGDRRPHVAWTEEMMYDPSVVDLPINFIDTTPTREHRSRYYTDITGLDYEMGHVLHYLNNKLGDNIFTLFSSDHGAQWPFGKWNLYDTGIRTPLIVTWPGNIKPATMTDDMVSWIDILPTLLDIANAKIPENLDGKSFKSILLRNKDEGFRDEIYTTHTGDGKFNIYPIRSIRTNRYKLIYNVIPEAYHSNHSDILRKPGAGAYWDSWDEEAKKDPRAASIINKYYLRPAWEFYDLSVDVGEQNNLINDSAYSNVINTLKEKLEIWMEEQEDDAQAHREPYTTSGPRPNRSFIEK